MRVPVVRHSTRRRRALRRRVLWSGAELLVTAGVVLLLFVVHQVWWTNREAKQGAGRTVEALEKQWAVPADGDGSARRRSAEGGTRARTSTAPPDPTPGRTGRSEGSRGNGNDGDGTSAAPHASSAYAILTIPRLHLRVPVAEGTSKRHVLDKGYVGHYTGTQQPGQAGNFAVAGHRNTHGEPFRYVNRLRKGDTVEVETRGAVYTYAVDRTLPRTSARDGTTLARVPRSTTHPAYGYSEPGYYLTLTTCTPEYTSRYRLVVWARLTSMRPR
ncbi:class E sortase [Streptomyces griseus]|uniref:class E sortase n=1 Tax=Streptomyces griseus TaxID=1911 RepID=UPI00055A5F2B|nr:class E sortase [Streptomyces griseus]